MTINKNENYIEITPDEGLYLFNGRTLAIDACCPISSDLSKWMEVSEEDIPNLVWEIDEIPEEDID